MPISTTINSPAALYALMTTTNVADLSQSYTQTTDIDMTSYAFPSQSIASGLTTFSGTYDGQNHTITIGNVVTTGNGFTGLFHLVAFGTITNVNLIYNNAIAITLVNLIGDEVWGGLVANMDPGTVTNCTVAINGTVAILSGTIDTVIGLFCGAAEQNSSITNSSLYINNTINLEGSTSSFVGLFCGSNTDSDIQDCTITTSASAYSISLKGDSDSSIGLISGYTGGVILSSPIERTRLQTITANLQNTGSIVLDKLVVGSTNVSLGAISGSLIGDITPGTLYVTEAIDCTVNITNNQTLQGTFDDFFGVIGGTNTIQNCQFAYNTTTTNTSRPLTITPAPSNATVTYVNNYSNTYALSFGNYYIPNTIASLTLQGGLALQSTVVSPIGIIINGVLYQNGETYVVSGGIYTIAVKGVGSMYFGIGVQYMPPTSAIQCDCQINDCAPNPQTGVTGDSRVTHQRENTTIRANVNREFATHSVIAPKFKTYADYMKYLQAGLKY